MGILELAVLGYLARKAWQWYQRRKWDRRARASFAVGAGLTKIRK